MFFKKNNFKNPYFKKGLYLIFTIIISIGLSISLQSLLAAWTAPALNAPAGNAEMPVNQGTLDQAKIGGLSLGGSFSVSGNTAILGSTGIGTTTPNQSLHIYKTSGDNAEIDIQSVEGINKHWAFYHDRGSDDFRIWNNTPAGEKNILTVTNEGNVGIGIINPAQKLDVAGNIHASGDICTDAGGGKCLSAGAVNSASFKAVTDMILRYYGTCALLEDGTVKCWGGENTYGRFGLGDVNNRQLPFTLPLINIKQVFLGGHHACAVDTSGSAWCWGHDGQGQLGNGGANSSSMPYPVQVQGLNDIDSVVIGNNNWSHTCALRTTGNVSCWGHNFSGQLGDGTLVDKGSPVTVISNYGTPLTNIVAIDSGYGNYGNQSVFNCALSNTGTISCWGYNGQGQLGVGHTNNQPYAQSVGINNATKVKTGGGGGGTACALLADKTMKCWGYNAYGQVGNGTLDNATSPVSVSNLTDVKDFDIARGSGYTHVCALLENNEVKCWGYNFYGQVGDGTSGAANYYRTSPVNVKDKSTGENLVLDGAKEVKISTGSDGANDGAASLSCVYSDNEMKCWGYNGQGQLGAGYNSPASETKAVSVLGLNNIKTLKTYSYAFGHMCAILNDGRAKCWGYNTPGQLGVGNALSTNIPHFVKTLNTD